MHEASIAAPLLRLVLESVTVESQREGRELHIIGVLIRTGLLQCLEARTLSGIFAIMAEGTPAEGAAITVETDPMRGNCPDCGSEVEIVKRSFACPCCGGEQVNWVGGNELYIASITVRPEIQEKK